MRGRSPFGNPVLWIVAAFVIPELVKKCKPLAKVMGDALTSAGEALHKAAEEPPKVAVVAEEHKAEEPAAGEQEEPAHEKSQSNGSGTAG